MRKGRVEERRAILPALLEDRFGNLPAAVLEQIDGWPPERLVEAIKHVHGVQSLKDLGLE